MNWPATTASASHPDGYRTRPLGGGPRIVLVEDETALAEAVKARLESEGYTVSLAHDGPSAVEMVARLAPDLVLLDIQLPGFDGLEVCRRIQRDRAVPVIMLTARSTETDLVVGLAMGADDYLAKPFSPRELVARVKALLRRVQLAKEVARDEPSAPKRYEIGALVLDTGARTVSAAGDIVHLTATEFDLLAWFLEYPSQVFTREQLLRSVWGYADGSGPRTVDSHVQAVRRKVGAAVVRTVHGVGYGLGSPPGGASGGRKPSA